MRLSCDLYFKWWLVEIRALLHYAPDDLMEIINCNFQGQGANVRFGKRAVLRNFAAVALHVLVQYRGL